MNWDEVTNGDLLRLAEQNSFDVFLTCDQGIAYQQNLVTRKIAIVELRKNNWPSIEPVVHNIAATINAAYAGTYTVVECAYVYRSRKQHP